MFHCNCNFFTNFYSFLIRRRSRRLFSSSSASRNPGGVSLYFFRRRNRRSCHSRFSPSKYSFFPISIPPCLFHSLPVKPQRGESRQSPDQRRIEADRRISHQRDQYPRREKPRRHFQKAQQQKHFIISHPLQGVPSDHQDHQERVRGHRHIQQAERRAVCLGKRLYPCRQDT